MAIIVYNRTKEDYSDRENNYPIYRPSILSNPYTHIKDKKTLASFVVRTRDEAIDRYEAYFDRMYKGNAPFKFIIDEIYEKYKRGEDVYLECYCKPERCHGDIIKEKLEKRLVKEKIREAKEKHKIERACPDVIYNPYTKEVVNVDGCAIETCETPEEFKKKYAGKRWSIEWGMVKDEEEYWKKRKEQ